MNGRNAIPAKGRQINSTVKGRGSAESSAVKCTQLLRGKNKGFLPLALSLAMCFMLFLVKARTPFLACCRSRLGESG
ncbi:MAG: hypothetical protein C4334_02265 [Pyrinomonas sp.]